MKRIARRTFAGIIGLALGWFAAGFLPSSLYGPGVTMAQDHPHAEHAATTQPSEQVVTSAADEAMPHGDGHHGEGHPAGAAEHDERAGYLAAMQLVPRDPQQQIAWYPCVLRAAVALFVAAVVLGIPSLKIRGPLPPDPADTHDDHDSHDDHAAHDDHGHAKAHH